MFQCGNFCPSTEGWWMSHLPRLRWRALPQRPQESVVRIPAPTQILTRYTLAEIQLRKYATIQWYRSQFDSRNWVNSVEEKARRLDSWELPGMKDWAWRWWIIMDHHGSSWIGAWFMASWCTKWSSFSGHRMAWSAGVPIWRTCATQETWRETRLLKLRWVQ